MMTLLPKDDDEKEVSNKNTMEKEDMPIRLNKKGIKMKKQLEY